jgi:hypothetical protein
MGMERPRVAALGRWQLKVEPASPRTLELLGLQT